MVLKTLSHIFKLTSKNYLITLHRMAENTTASILVNFVRTFKDILLFHFFKHVQCLSHVKLPWWFHSHLHPIKKYINKFFNIRKYCMIFFFSRNLKFRSTSTKFQLKVMYFMLETLLLITLSYTSAKKYVGKLNFF